MFVDNFLVYGGTFNLCLQNLTKVLHRCERVNLVLNWKKCHFIAQEEVVLGHIVSKIEVIEQFPTPLLLRG